MEVLILTIFVSLVLAGMGVGFFAWTLKNRAHEHADRLTLLPLQDDDAPASGEGASTDSPRSKPRHAKGTHQS